MCPRVSILLFLCAVGLFAYLPARADTMIELNLRFKFTPDNPDYGNFKRVAVPRAMELMYEDGTTTGELLSDRVQKYGSKLKPTRKMVPMVSVGHMSVVEYVTAGTFCEALKKA